jgi:hypothetical protein
MDTPEAGILTHFRAFESGKMLITNSMPSLARRLHLSQALADTKGGPYEHNRDGRSQKLFDLDGFVDRSACCSATRACRKLSSG